MSELEELEALLSRLADIIRVGKREAVSKPKESLRASAEVIGKAASGSWLGYHSRVYYERLAPPPPGHHFSVEWGLRQSFGRPTSLGFREFNDEDVQKAIHLHAGSPRLATARKAAESAAAVFTSVKEEFLALLHAFLIDRKDPVLEAAVEEVKRLKILSTQEYVLYVRPTGTFSTRDSVVANQGFQVPPHVKVQAEIFELDAPFAACDQLVSAVRPAFLHFQRLTRNKGEEQLFTNASTQEKRIFIGHGHSPAWKDLKDFLSERLTLAWDEFNREAVAGHTTVERLKQMLDVAGLAFLVMTGEDEQGDGRVLARQNVVHEVGLFQGRLGFSKAIVLLEEGCEEFSNINGLAQLRFPKGKISAIFEDIRRVLERENLLPAPKRS